MTRLSLAALAALMACQFPAEARHASKSDRYYHSPDSRITHHRGRHAADGGNASVFCDKVTASGHGMNCGAMVFAHRTLPLGSVHTLCGPRACVAARVADRGPYVRGRTFDLSPGLAKFLGVNGLGNVRIRM